jgi:hypothetical protein
MKTLLGVVLLLSLSLSTTQAGMVNLDLQTDQATGTWVLQAIVSQADNAGLCAVMVDLTGIDTAHLVAQAQGFNSYGGPLDSSTYEVIASQNVLLGGQAMVYGAGQQTGVPMRLFEGTYSTGTPSFTDEKAATVFDSADSVEVFSADIGLFGSMLGSTAAPTGYSNTITLAASNGQVWFGIEEAPIPPAVPVPASVVLGVLGLGIVSRLRRQVAKVK